MTTRIDHTHCTHDRTPRGRATCRTRRNAAIKTAQVAYAALWAVDSASGETYDLYYALVDDVSFFLGVTLREAYTIVENGPVIC